MSGFNMVELIQRKRDGGELKEKEIKWFVEQTADEEMAPAQLEITMSEYNMVELIKRKRDGGELEEKEIKWFVEQTAKKTLPESQLGAMLMAIFWRGMTVEESKHLTLSMMHSGEVLSWPAEWKGLVVDKHSTGGVGDKTSLPLTPALAACGLKVPMISGRGLGITGGTLDKMESIPGLSVSISPEQIHEGLDKNGCCLVGQTDMLVPADKIMYLTRDITATVESLPLIVGSIMSKKAAESPDALVLELTYGNAAPMKTIDTARELAQAMIDTGNAMGIKTTSLLTKMDTPIGKCIGNSLEVLEAVQCLQGSGPDDLKDMVCDLGGELLHSVGKATSSKTGGEIIRKKLDDGSAKAKFVDMIVSQGVSQTDAEKLFSDPRSLLPFAASTTPLKSEATGWVHGIHAEKCGLVSYKLGAGRTKPSDSVDPGVGLELAVQVGDRITAGDVWVKVYHSTPLTEDLVDTLKAAIEVKDAEVPEEAKQRISEHLG